MRHGVFAFIIPRNDIDMLQFRARTGLGIDDPILQFCFTLSDRSGPLYATLDLEHSIMKFRKCGKQRIA
jgi:hypothetical protein